MTMTNEVISKDKQQYATAMHVLRNDFNSVSGDSMRAMKKTGLLELFDNVGAEATLKQKNCAQTVS